MQYKKKKLDKSFFIAVILSAGFFISIIPILYAGFFCHPVADDYSFSYMVHDAVLNGSSIFKAVIDTVIHIYTSWQGTFAAIAIFSLQPGAFSPSCYYLTTFIMLGFLIGSTFFLFYTIIKKMLHGTITHVIIFSTITLIMSIQFVPNINSTFYWFNGSAYYTLFYSFALLLFALLLRLRITESNKSKYILFISSFFLALIIGGGNYTTALIVAELLVLMTIAAFYQKSSKKWLFLIILFAHLASFIINMIAPGNSVRGAAVQGLSPIMAIEQSLFYALVKIADWTDLPQLVYIIAVAILAVFLIPKCSAKFKYPILVLGISFLLFASQLTPPLYAMSNIGAGRQIDIYYYSYYLLISFQVFYLSGWVYRQLIEQNIKQNLFNSLGVDSLIKKHLLEIFIILGIIWGMGCYVSPLGNMASARTTSAILDGSLVQYDNEYKTLLTTLETESGNLVVEDIKSVPSIFSNLGLSDDPENWNNKAVAKYFGLESIKTPSEN